MSETRPVITVEDEKTRIELQRQRDKAKLKAVVEAAKRQGPLTTDEAIAIADQFEKDNPKIKVKK